MNDLLNWVETNQEELARLDDKTPYQDPFGEDIVGVNEDEEPEYDDEFMNEEDLGRVETWGTRRNEDDDEEN